MNYQVCLQRLATDSYRNKEEAAQLLVQLAEGYWHKKALLTLDAYEGANLQKAAYLLELLTNFYPSLDEEQAVFARAALGQASLKLKVLEPVTFYHADEPSRFGFDDVAAKWGLTAGASPRKVSGFLDLQRRMFSESPGKAA